jgi:Extensin-like protein C-terminus
MLVGYGVPCLALFALAALVAAPASAKPPTERATAPDEDGKNVPSATYGAMSGGSCRAELAKRKIPFRAEADAPGVLAPVRIPEGLGGIRFHTLVRDQDRPTPWEVFDCRLVLALHDFATILADHGVDDVVIFSAWRPPGKKWPEGKLAKRHPGALAVDVMRLRWTPPAAAEAEQTGPKDPPEPLWVDVRKDFHGRIGDRTCGRGARGPRRKTPQAEVLRAVVCEAAEARLFTSMLTPNYDRHHHDHLHLEVTPKVKWRMVR